ncbi:MAG: hypothetical protein EOO65_04890 [Methanosarcinales archaeon]|nr:MAG: hypothetical protein EOO65_04890 [Methanosarcinales archaeon]
MAAVSILLHASVLCTTLRWRTSAHCAHSACACARYRAQGQNGEEAAGDGGTCKLGDPKWIVDAAGSCRKVPRMTQLRREDACASRPKLSELDAGPDSLSAG